MEEQNIKQIPSIKQVNYLYLITMALFVFTGEVIYFIKPPSISTPLKMILIVLMQVIFVFLPICIFLIIKNIDIKNTLRLNKISVANAILAMFIIIISIPLAGLLNSIVIIILSYFGKVHPPADFTANTLPQLLINLLIVAVTPAIFEEIFFRGVVLKGYEKLGSKLAIIISAALFALMHRDVQSLVGTFVLGTIIAYIVYRTNSLFGGMIAHFTNNASVLILTYFIGKVPKSLDNTNNILNLPNLDQFSKMDTVTMITIIAAIVIILVFILFLIGIFIGLIMLFRYTTKNISHENISVNSRIEEHNTVSPLLISIILVFYVYIKQLI